jgi:hypothetical protein
MREWLRLGNYWVCIHNVVKDSNYYIDFSFVGSDMKIHRSSGTYTYDVTEVFRTRGKTMSEVDLENYIISQI